MRRTIVVSRMCALLWPCAGACGSTRSESLAYSGALLDSSPIEASAPPPTESFIVGVELVDVRAQWNGTFGTFFPEGDPTGNTKVGFSGLEIPPDITKLAAFVTATTFAVDEGDSPLEVLEEKIAARFNTAAAALGSPITLGWPPVKTGGGDQWLTVANEEEALLAYPVMQGSAPYERTYYQDAARTQPIGTSKYWVLFSHSDFPH